jgi:hypothetical protein
MYSTIDTLQAQFTVVTLHEKDPCTVLIHVRALKSFGMKKNINCTLHGRYLHICFSLVLIKNAW